MEALLNLHQAAEVLGLAEVTVRKLVRHRRLTAVKIGRRLLFEPEGLRRFIARNRTGLNHQEKSTDLNPILGLWQKHTTLTEENHEPIFTLGGHPKPAIDGHLKTGQRRSAPGH